MKCATTPEAITHLVEVGMAKTVSEYIDAMKAENERLKSIMRQTDRLMLIDGEFEAYSVGTLERANAKLERLIEAGDALAELVEPPYEVMKQDEYPLWAAEIDLMKRWNSAKNLNS